MNRDEYEVWAEEHCTAFGLLERREAEMVLSWFGIFTNSGLTVVDLRAASAAMIHPGPAPQYRSDHLRLIQTHARIAARARARKAESSRIEGASICGLCDGSSWVIVPHPHALVDGRMIRSTTLAVSCPCHLGQAMQSRERPPLSFEKYSRWNPRWKEQLAEWESSQSSAGTAHAAAQHADKTHGPLVRRLASQIGRAIT